VEKMKEQLHHAEGHFLIFGNDRELAYKIIEGLLSRGEEVYYAGEDEEIIQDFRHEYNQLKFIKTKIFKADAMDELRPDKAACAYLLFDRDEPNILLAAMLEGRVNRVGRFSGNPNSYTRFRRVGVEPISPHFSGGLKMVSTMIRPVATEFLGRYVLPERSLLEFRNEKYVKPAENGTVHGIPICRTTDGILNFDEAPVEGETALILSFRDISSVSRKLGNGVAATLRIRHDRFLILGGGIIGATVLGEVHATRRGAMIIEPHRDKLRELKHNYGEDGIVYHVGEGGSAEYNVRNSTGWRSPLRRMRSISRSVLILSGPESIGWCALSTTTWSFTIAGSTRNRCSWDGWAARGCCAR
jgi:Trk K+ transport system NAD-binding subunit